MANLLPLGLDIIRKSGTIHEYWKLLMCCFIAADCKWLLHNICAEVCIHLQKSGKVTRLAFLVTVVLMRNPCVPLFPLFRCLSSS